MEVKLKRTEPMQVVTISHVGLYGEVGKLYEEIVKWLNPSTRSALHRTETGCQKMSKRTY